MLKRCLIHNQRYKIINTDRQSSLMVTAQRHKPIIDALESGDTGSVVDAISLHVTTIVDLGPSILPVDPSLDSGVVEPSK